MLRALMDLSEAETLARAGYGRVSTALLAELDRARALLDQRTADHDAVVTERNELAEQVAALEAALAAKPRGCRDD